MFSYDTVVHLVSGAAIAGEAESRGSIAFGDAEELTTFLVEQKKLYDGAVNKAMNDYLGDSNKWPNWYDWITDALNMEYGK